MYDPNNSNSFNRFRDMISRQGATSNSNDYGLGSGSPGVSSYGMDESGGGNPPLNRMGPPPNRGWGNSGPGLNRPMPRAPFGWRNGPQDTGFGPGENQAMPHPQGGPNWRGAPGPYEVGGFGPGESQAMPIPGLGGPGRNVGGPTPLDPMRSYILLAGQNPNSGFVPPGIPPSLPPTPKQGWDWTQPPQYAGPWNK